MQIASGMTNEQSAAPALTEKQLKAIDLLYEAMIFWHDEGSKLIKKLIFKLNVEDNARAAFQVQKTWKDVDDRWIEIAGMILPYQEAKKASIDITKTETKRFVIEAPRVITDKREWLEKVKEEQALLPKPIIINNAVEQDNGDIDEIEYGEVNE